MPAVVFSCDIRDWMADAPLGQAEGDIDGLDGHGTLDRGWVCETATNVSLPILELKLPSLPAWSGGPSLMSTPHISLGRPRIYP